MSEEKATKQSYKRTVSLSNSKPDSKVYSFSMDNRVFWVVLIGICVLLGIMLGVIAFESRVVLHFTNEAITSRKEYAALQRQHEKTLIENEDLQEEVKVLTDSINARAQLDEQLKAEEEQRKIPDGFPVTGTVTQAEMPEEDTELDMAAYYTGGWDSVIVATADGKVVSIRENAYEYYEVQIDHENGYISIYTNKEKPIIVEGANVTTGTPIYYIHEENTFLKYQITYNGALVNVYDVMQIAG